MPIYTKLYLEAAKREEAILSKKIREKARTDPANNWAFAQFPTKLERKRKPSMMSIRKHRVSGHPLSGSHNPKIKENRKREAKVKVRTKNIRNPKTSIKELFGE